jgi:predicted neuraminidase
MFRLPLVELAHAAPGTTVKPVLLVIAGALMLSLSMLRPATLCAQPAAVSIERVMGPEVPTGRYKHPASITELDSGDLYIAYYGGDGEYSPGTAVYGTRLAQGRVAWSQPVVLAKDPFYSLGNGVVWQSPGGIVWLFYVIRPGATWSTSRIAAKISNDGAKTWSDSSMVTFEQGLMVRSQPLALPGGDILLPVYRETGEPEFVGPDTCSLFLRFDPETKQWSESNRVYSRLGNLQPAVAQVDENHLIAYCRRGADYEPRTDGFLVRTESRDGGKTWSEGRETAFPNPNAAVDFIRLRSGNLMLVYNDSMSSRTPLTAALSIDGGKTFRPAVNIAEGENSFAYPYAIQTRDGKIRVIYTSDGRSVINMAVFEETLLLGE